MSEPVAKERPAVDLDDFERRLSHQDHHQEDPLAELARLVGETHDPYGDVFAQEAIANPGSAHHSYQPGIRYEPAFDPPPRNVSPRLSGDFAAIEAGLRGALPTHPEAGYHDAAHAADLYAQHPDHYAESHAYAPHDQAYLHDHEDRQWAGAPVSSAAQPASRSRRPIFAMVATIAVGVVGVGVAFAYKGASSSPSEIRTISAAAGPNKVHPPADTASDQSNQDPAILGKNGQPTPTRLVSGEEQPVDISQAVQENASRNADAGTTPGDASGVPVPPSPGETAAAPGGPDRAPAAATPDQVPTFGMTDMPPPKKVKVVSVRPDGTILSGDAPPIAGITPSPMASTPSDDTSTPVASPATPKTSTPKTASKPGKSTSRVAAGSKATPIAGDADGDRPAPKSARKVKPKRVASADPTDLSGATQPAGVPADPPAGNTDPTASLPTSKPAGGFAVQLAAPGSESEARSASSRLAKKYAGALDGRHLGYHRAQSNGKSVYRVRVSSLSKDEAVSLCEKLKADGGSCFVAKNN